jgi:hypothetical protein
MFSSLVVIFNGTKPRLEKVLFFFKILIGVKYMEPLIQFLFNLLNFFEHTLTTCLFVFKKILVAKIIFLQSLNGEVGWNKNTPSIFLIFFSYQFKACKADVSEVENLVLYIFGLNHGERKLYFFDKFKFFCYKY